MKNLSVILLLSFLFSCEHYRNHIPVSGITLIRSEAEYSSVVNAGNGMDPFTIRDFHISGDSAMLTVMYSGGCREHSFNIIWGESFIKTYPPQIDLIVSHNANGDECKEMTTETLSFNLKKLTGPIDYETVVVNILNGSSLADTPVSDKWKPSDINVYNIDFPEGESCQVEITAMTVICGAGIWDNLWFAMNDSVPAGEEGKYFRKWLQPVAISDKLKGFSPVPGKKYLVGATVQRVHPYLNVAVCLAFSGPSVPIRINCVTELK